MRFMSLHPIALVGALPWLALVGVGAGCDDRRTPADLATPSDFSVARDLRVPADLATTVDLGVPVDAAPQDFALPPDLALSPDLAPPPDLAVAPDLAQGNGAYRIGAATAGAPALHGGFVGAVSGTTTSVCPAGSVAVGIAVLVEGRSYVQDVQLQCAALDNTGMAFAAGQWPNGAPGASWKTATCALGQHLVGFVGSAGDIIDRVGGNCAALGWTGVGSLVKLGPFGNNPAANNINPVCPPPAALGQLTVSPVDYYGGPTARDLVGGCTEITH